MAPITLTTDFGERDSYVAQMKGVIAGIAPSAPVVDVTHEVPPQNIRVAALIAEQIAATFPPGTVHVIVVDPGVGTDRRILLAELDEQRFVVPDNGILTRVWRNAKRRRALELTNSALWRRVQSHTFHGRDRMAPAAAHWWAGVPLDQFGPPLDQPPVRLHWPEPQRQGERIRGEVLYVDRFGNLATNIPGNELQGRHVRRIVAGPVQIGGISAAFAEVPPGRWVALINSWGMLELAVNRGDAAALSGLKPGDPVIVELSGAPDEEDVCIVQPPAD